MIFLGFLLVAAVASANAQFRPTDPRAMPARNVGRPAHPAKSNTVIENKNVNIIVNVDPKDVANELYKLIQNRLDARPSRRTASNDSRQTKKELEQLVAPMVNPSRRSLPRPSPFEVAYKLDHLTRRALLGERLASSTIGDEIVARQVVIEMLTKLSSVTESTAKTNETSSPEFRRMMLPNDQTETNEKSVDDDNDDRFITVKLRIRKSELLRRSANSPDVDS